MLWRTTGLWGTGLGRDLNPDEIDGNFFELAEAIDALVAAGGINSIDDFTVVGDQMTVLMTDHTTRGPFTLPNASWNDTGAWQALHIYSLRDTFSINGGVYEVIFAHTSAASFDAGANNGMGDDYYHLMLSSPDNVLPEFGTTRMALLKTSNADFDTEWDFISIEDLSDVALGSPLVDGDSLVWDEGLGKWTSRALAQVFNFDDIIGSVQRDQAIFEQAQDVTQDGATLEIDRTFGDYCNLVLTGNISSLTITDVQWFEAAHVNKMILVVVNTGAFNITNWNGAIWPNGHTPTVTSGAASRDVFELTTYDGGSNVYGRIIGQDYS